MIAALALAVGACGGDASGPSDPALAGTYVMTELRFDPQGLLPATDLLGRLDSPPNLVLAPAGEAQLVFVSPTTGLITIVDGSYSTPGQGARIAFGSAGAVMQVLLSERMTFTFDANAGTLRFNDASPDGVSRARLIELAPEFADEQLLDPVPGELVVTFTRSS